MNHNMYVSGVTEVEIKSTEEGYSIFWKGETLFTVLWYLTNLVPRVLVTLFQRQERATRTSGIKYSPVG